MPTDAFYYMNDEDLANTIAYLKTIPAVDAVLPAKRVGPLARVLYLSTGFPWFPQRESRTRGRGLPLSRLGALASTGIISRRPVVAKAAISRISREVFPLPRIS